MTFTDYDQSIDEEFRESILHGGSLLEVIEDVRFKGQRKVGNENKWARRTLALAKVTMKYDLLDEALRDDALRIIEKRYGLVGLAPDEVKEMEAYRSDLLPSLTTARASKAKGLRRSSFLQLVVLFGLSASYVLLRNYFFNGDAGSTYSLHKLEIAIAIIPYLVVMLILKNRRLRSLAHKSFEEIVAMHQEKLHG